MLDRDDFAVSSRFDRDAYVRDGYLVVSGLFGPEDAAQWHHEARRLWDVVADDLGSARVHWRDRVSGGRVADRIDPVLDLSPHFEAVANDPRLLALVERALGGAPKVFKAKLISKWTGTHGYAMHQDHPYWAGMNIPPDHMLSVQLAIDPSTSENGAIEVLPGMHRERYEAPSDEPCDIDESKLGHLIGTAMELGAGDVGLLHSMTPHRSQPNRSEGSRESLIVSYTLARYQIDHETYRRHASTPRSLRRTG